MEQEFDMTPGDFFDIYERNVVDMAIDICLIRLVRDYGERVNGFNDDCRYSAIERSLDFMDGCVDEFKAYFNYIKSDQFIKQRYEKLKKHQQESADTGKEAEKKLKVV